MTCHRPPLSVCLTLASPEATTAFGVWLAPQLHPGDILLLEGEIGAGKSHLARALIQARLASEGRHEDVPSPSYTLVQVYDTAAGEIWHTDLYRLSDPAQIWELGLDQAFDDALCLVEWPDRLGADRPCSALTVTLSIAGDEGRRAVLSADAPRWQGLIADAARLFGDENG